MSSETGAPGATPMDWEAVARYLAGESSAEEQATVQRWLSANPTDARTIAALDDVLRGVALKPELQQGIDVHAAFASVKGRREHGLKLLRANAAVAAERGPLRAPRNRAITTAIAAGVAFFIVGAIWRTSRVETAAEPTTIAARTLTTPVGGRDSLILPDGSQVMLGPGSELRIGEGYGQADRQVSLRGEALFTVVHDADKPFVVTANGSQIRDIGTAFVVHSDAGGVRVAVTDGIVELKAPSQAGATTLNVGDAATVAPGGQVTTERGVGAAADLAWTQGKLVFRDTPLSEVSEDLRRWYGVTLDIQDPALRRRPLSAEFQGDSVASVLEVMSKALGATFERRGDVVVVRPVPR